MQKREIQHDELLQYIPELEAAVEAVCKSPPFRTSAKSCQFLRHIVQHTLKGNADELKERLIGIELLGREASYDTGSDAAVRVRANDVRKRLNAYYAAGPSDLDFTFDIPAGSYVPRFFVSRDVQSVPLEPSPASTPEQSSPPAEQLGAPQLSLPQLAFPSLVALFLCVICLRWQLTQEHPFVTFWNTVFQDRHALLYVPPSRLDGKQQVIPIDRLEDTAPLFRLAGQFHAPINLTSTLASPIGENDILILIGAIPAPTKEPASGPLGSQDASFNEGGRLVIDNSPSGRKIVDHGTGVPRVMTYGRAALLTIDNGTEHSIHIDGTDDAAIDSLIKLMCEPNAFPDELIDSFQPGTVTQIVFPMEPSAQALIFHESLPVRHTAMNGSL